MRKVADQLPIAFVIELDVGETAVMG